MKTHYYLYIMWSLILRSNIMLRIGFKEFFLTMNQTTINDNSNKNYQKKKFIIPDELSNKVIKFKCDKEKLKKIIEKTVT